MERPVARIVGDDVERADRTDRHVDRDLRPLCTFGHPATVRATDREAMACRWIGWLVMVRLPIRTRTLSPSRTGSESIPGNTRLFHVHMLKSVISLTLGRYVPGSMR